MKYCVDFVSESQFPFAHREFDALKDALEAYISDCKKYEAQFKNGCCKLSIVLLEYEV